MPDTARTRRPARAATGRPRPRFTAWPGRLAALAAALVLAAGAGGAVARGAAPGALAVDESACGAPPASLAAGPVAFQVTDDAATAAFAAVYLISPARGDVYAEITEITPGKTQTLAATLGAGTYALRCVFSDGAVLTSAPVAVTGTTGGAVPGYPPMPDLALTRPVDAYRAYVQAALPGLLAASRALDADVARGDLAAARTDWLTAHLDYERLGAAYNSFGDFDDELDGTAGGLPQGVRSSGWTGFFSVEYALWHGSSATEIRPLTRNLVSTVLGLIADFPSEEVDPGDLPLRAHEILENALQFQLTGIADYGSGTSLATVYANTQGTQEVLSILTPLIRPRDPALLATATTQLSAVQRDLLAARTPAGGWTPVGALGTGARQRLDGDLGALLENLAMVPDLLTPRTSA
jgi:iron uptake system EfeUOB component EfeO/EfeM